MSLWNIFRGFVTVIGFMTIAVVLALGVIIIKARDARHGETISQLGFNNMGIHYFPVDTSMSVGHILNAIDESYHTNIDAIGQRVDQGAEFLPPKAVLYFNLDNNTVAVFMDYFLDCGCSSLPLIRCNLIPDSTSEFVMNGSCFLRVNDLEYYVYGNKYKAKISGTGQ